ncbi:MAG: glycosyltransferase [Gemmatimonadales bacterium]
MTGGGYAIVIPSANADNLAACLSALRGMGELGPDARIIVVDDGARAGAHRSLDNFVSWIPGKRPFVYARNANLGIEAAGRRDVVLMGDDTVLATDRGLERLARTARAHPRAAVIAAAVDGMVGNARQARRDGPAAVELEPEWLAFVCVYLPRAALDGIGPLDERFVAYGGEDVDFCLRARAMGWELLDDHGCVVEHGRLPSSFRSRPDISELSVRGVQILRSKWGGT